MRPVLIACLTLVLCGCSYDAKWIDVSGQDRSEAAARADQGQCQREAAYPEDRVAQSAEYEIAAERFRNCMSERGWKMDRR